MKGNEQKLLKRDCPFCGQSKDMYISVKLILDDVEKPWYVHCQACDGRTGNYYTRDEAVDAWNGDYDSWKEEF